MANPLDAVWDAVNACGGVGIGDRFDQGYDLAISNALSEIEKLGGMDPVIRAAQERRVA